jgi:DNA-binding MarR family transcriptional regulator
MSDVPAFSLVAQALRTASVLVRESRRLFRPFGLTEAQFNVLNVLGGVTTTDAGLTQRELSDILVVDRSNVTGLLDRMEKAGWVRRSDHAGDRRAWRVEMTPKGRKLWRSALPAYQRAVRAALRPIDGGDIRVAIETLQALEKQAARIGPTLREK